MNKKSLNDLLLDKEAKCTQQIYLRQPRNGVWHEFSWGKAMQQARQVAAFLQSQGLKKGDKVSIFSKNCAEWFIADFGISLAGMINVPLFGNQHVESIHYVLEHAEVKLVFVGKLDMPEEASANIPANITRVSFDYHTNISVSHQWTDVLAMDPLKEVIIPEAEDLYTIIYTSGTSGRPKGAVYTHETLANYLEVFPKDIRRHSLLEHHHFISYLPLAHVYERTAIQLASVSISCDVSFVESLEHFAENLREVRPTIFTAVPRIWGVFQQKIEAKLPPAKMNLLLKIPFVSGLIKKKIHKQLGLDRAANCASGASHLPISIIDFFEKLDIVIQEGYGQTENLAYATLTVKNERKKGYVGQPRLNVEIKKGEQDEILIKSDCLMKEYYKNEDATNQSFVDGWLRTGDIGEIDEHQNLKIICRLTEMIKNQKGEFIFPGPIEKDFSSNNLVEQLCLIGQGLVSNVMVVALSEKAHKMDKESLRQSLASTMRRVNGSLMSYEKIGHVVITPGTWTPENGILTPTLKVKRREIIARFLPEIEKAAIQREPVYWIEE